MGRIDENYFKTNHQEYHSIKDIVNHDEEILWQGKPKKKAYILNAFFKMFPIAVIWLLFDGTFIFFLGRQSEFIPGPMKIFMVIFFLFHLLPVWIWLSGVITANRQHKNLEYAFTDKRIIIKM